MLLPDNIHPEQTLYYNGSIILKILLEEKESKLLDLYSKVFQSKNMSFNLFILSIDWLFIAGLVDYKNDGGIIICL
jgi:hypothetical protein